jgi:tRNA-2-methylthio-N6-dimethylallyladenosine synthase
MAEIITEAEALVGDGVKEITLLGQTVNAWGHSEGRSLGELLHALELLDGLERVRFITSHPEEMDDELIEAMAACRKAGLFLHLPPQSGSDRVLRRMARGYTAERYREIVDRLRAAIPGVALGADIIVGFCGETDEDFEATYRLLEDIRFSQAFLFRYSPRPDTPAFANLKDDVPDEVKRERLSRLMELQRQVQVARHQAMLGSVHEVLVEGRSLREPTLLFGRNLAFDRIVFEAAETLTDSLVRVQISSATALTLSGRLVSPSEAPAAVAGA